MKVYATFDIANHKVSLSYNPPPSLWRFRNKTGEQLEQELTEKLTAFLHTPMNKQSLMIMEAQMKFVFDTWINNGYLYFEKIEGIDYERF